MSKREKYEEAVRVLEDAFAQLERHFAECPDGAIKKIAARRRKQLIDGIVALGGGGPGNEEGPGP